MIENFRAQYDKLSSIANELKTNPELDIDVLLSKVREAIACHKICKARLEAATKELDSILQETIIEEADIAFKAKAEDADVIPF